jgi:hypothetical protein
VCHTVEGYNERCAGNCHTAAGVNGAGGLNLGGVEVAGEE